MAPPRIGGDRPVPSFPPVGVMKADGVKPAKLPEKKADVRGATDDFQAGNGKAPAPLATSKYETRGIDAALDPDYDAEKWDNDGSFPVTIRNSSGDSRLDNLARSAAYNALHQDGMNGAQADMMVKGTDGKNYQLTLRRNGSDVSVDFSPIKRASEGKTADAMTKEMTAKGITVGKGFSKDELAGIYDGFATMKGKDLDAMKGVTLEKGTRKALDGTDVNEAAEYGNKKITFYKEAFGAGMVGNLPTAGATFLHEAGHRFEEVSGSLAAFQKTKGHANDITPYDGATATLSKQETAKDVKIDPRKEHYAEAYMLFKSDPKFLQNNYPQLYKFFEAQTK